MLTYQEIKVSVWFSLERTAKSSTFVKVGTICVTWPTVSSEFKHVTNRNTADTDETVGYGWRN